MPLHQIKEIDDELNNEGHQNPNVYSIRLREDIFSKLMDVFSHGTCPRLPSAELSPALFAVLRQAVP